MADFLVTNSRSGNSIRRALGDAVRDTDCLKLCRLECVGATSLRLARVPSRIAFRNALDTTLFPRRLTALGTIRGGITVIPLCSLPSSLGVILRATFTITLEAALRAVLSATLAWARWAERTRIDIVIIVVVMKPIAS